MERAAQLLPGNHMTVTGVACAVGFVNRGSFAAAFKRKFGVNPSDYRFDRQLDAGATSADLVLFPLEDETTLWSQENRLQSPENVRQLRLLLLLIKPPVIIFQNDIVSQLSTTTITIPLTTNMRRASLPICVMIKRGYGGPFKCFALL